MKLRKILLFFATIFVGAFLLNMIGFDEIYAYVEQEFLVLLYLIIPEKLDRNVNDIVEVHDQVKVLYKDSNGNIKDFQLVGRLS